MNPPAHTQNSREKVLLKGNVYSFCSIYPSVEWNIQNSPKNFSIFFTSPAFFSVSNIISVSTENDFFLKFNFGLSKLRFPLSVVVSVENTWFSLINTMMRLPFWHLLLTRYLSEPTLNSDLFDLHVSDDELPPSSWCCHFINLFGVHFALWLLWLNDFLEIFILQIVFYCALKYYVLEAWLLESTLSDDVSRSGFV